jgi:inorganic pyrophosphatase
VRLIGEIRCVQRERGKRIRNDRLIGVVQTPVNRPKLNELADLEPEHLHAIEHFFTSYNQAQGREFRVTGRTGSRAANATLKRAERRAQTQTR